MLVKIGKIVNTQGIKGEVRVMSNSDFKDIRFKAGNSLTLRLRSGDIKLKIESSRPHKTFQLVKFFGLDNINDVIGYKNVDIYDVEFTDEQLEDDEYLNKDLVDCEVINNDGISRGHVVEVVENPAHNMLKIKGEKNFLIPFNEHFIIDVNIIDKKIIFDEIDGLID